MKNFGVKFLVGALVVAGTGVWALHSARLLHHESVAAVTYARDGLGEYAVLQETYKREHGRYAESSIALATVSSDPHGFLRNTAALYDEGRVAIRADEKHFAIAARATDPDKTLVAVSGP